MPGTWPRPNCPTLSSKKLPSLSVSVRGDDTYNVYSVDEKVFFDTGKSDIEPGAAAALQQITGSIGQRYATG